VAAALLLTLALRPLNADWHKAAALSAGVLLLFFSYGHLYQTLNQAGAPLASLGRHRFLIPAWLLLAVLLAYAVGRRVKEPARLTRILNIIALAVLVVPAYRILGWELQYRAASSTSTVTASDCVLGLRAEGPSPDVYYIILDGYARADVLAETYEYDNQDFLNSLTERGFFVAGWSQSNYAHTELSLASSLNMAYLPDLGVNYSADSSEREALWPLLLHGAVRGAFECLGYQIVTLDSGYYWTGWDDADVYLSPRGGASDRLRASDRINAFEALLVETSAGLILSDSANLMPDLLQSELDSPFLDHRARVEYALGAAESVVPALAGPKFVYLHLLVPHPPYVFNAQGEFLRPSGAFTLTIPDEKEGYPDQVAFINGRILQVVDGIRSASPSPPIIVIQGDHGLGSGIRDKMSILNAYLLPDVGEGGLYPTISPVNTFRVIFNTYFNGDFALLEDVSYYSPKKELYNFSVFPNPHTQ
jgi:hypothetical protein